MLFEKLQTIVGAKGCLTDPLAIKSRLTDWRGARTGSALSVVSPANVEEVSAVVRACYEARVSIVPQGGNTGMCGGAVPDTSGEQVVLCLGRMNAIRTVDAVNYSLHAEAGCILEDVQRAAREVDRIFALSLGAEGSCQIGGNLATNAGGINVIRYGTARAQVLGLEAVLANGTIVNSLRSLRKDTAGYDLKQLFIGSEGTLGIITAATLKLHPNPGSKRTALLTLNSSGDAVHLLAQLRSRLADTIEAFELMSEFVLGLVVKYVQNAALPFDVAAPWYVLLEVAEGDGNDALLRALTQAVEDELIVDAVIAKNGAEADAFWHMRHSIAEAERAEGVALKHDISVPISRIEEFLCRGDALLDELVPDGQLVAFGHVGDGNLHYNVALPAGFSGGEHVSAAVYSLVTELGGSFSAEHGVGRSKREDLPKYRSAAEIELMRSLKRCLDPQNILNPGKVI